MVVRAHTVSFEESEMSEIDKKLAVFNYIGWHHNSGTNIVPKGMRTAEWIKENNCTILPDTKTYIDYAELDEFDCYNPPEKTEIL